MINALKGRSNAPLLFIAMAVLLLHLGLTSSWNNALNALNFGLIAAIMALGVNLQWGYAGLFNVGIMGFVALGGLAVVVTSMPGNPENFAAGGLRVMAALVFGLGVIVGAVLLWGKLKAVKYRGYIITAFIVVGFFLYRGFFDPAVQAIEAINPSQTGSVGGLGLPVLSAWIVGGLLAAGAAWVVAKTALGLRSDYLAIATLGIAEIIVAVMKNEEWLTRGVKNVNGLPRPVPYEVDLQNSEWFLNLISNFGADPVTASTIFVKLCYAVLFLIVIGILLTLMQLALNSPWGRMVRAIRDNEVSSEAMGKDVTKIHLHIFVLGAAICGLAGAMMTTLDGQLTPTTYQPLRYTFLIWVMVIVGGSGNNWGAVLGGIFVWYLWTQVPEIAADSITYMVDIFNLSGDFVDTMISRLPYLRFVAMGAVLLLVLRFFPRGLLPEK